MSFFDHHVHAVLSGDSPVPLEERARTARDPARPHGISEHFPSPHLKTDGDVLRYVERAMALGLRVALEYDIGVAPPLRPSTRDALDYLVGGVHQVVVEGRMLSYDEAGAYLKARAASSPPAVRRDSAAPVYDDAGPYLKRQSAAYAERERFREAPLRRALLAAILEALRASFERDRVDVLAHPTFSPLATLDDGDAEAGYPAEWQDELIALCLRHGVALEVNESYRLPRASFLRRARAAGARFAVGSDSHHELVPLTFTEGVIAEAGIAEWLIEASGRAVPGT